MEIKRIILLTATGSKGDLYTLKLFIGNTHPEQDKIRLTCSCPAGMRGDCLCRHKRTLITRAIRKHDSEVYSEKFIPDMFDNGLNSPDDLELASIFLLNLGLVYIDIIKLYRKQTDKYYEYLSIIEKEIDRLEYTGDINQINKIDQIQEQVESQYDEQRNTLDSLLENLVLHD
ncbi:hypothetical protein OOO56_004306 [Salmonella enterica]|nr:hypothetical protein [Salmonella enterica]